MTPRHALLATALAAAFISSLMPLFAQRYPQALEPQPRQPGVAAEPQTAPKLAGEPQAAAMPMMARMKATTEKLDALVQKMNTAQGQAKTDAIAELLTALVEERRTTCAPMMAGMMSMMSMMGEPGSRGEPPAATQK